MGERKPKAFSPNTHAHTKPPRERGAVRGRTKEGEQERGSARSKTKRNKGEERGERVGSKVDEFSRSIRGVRTTK